MVKANVIHKRLKKLDEYLTFLHQLQQHDRQTFLSDPKIYGSTERFLHLAIECLLDMGNHLVADDELGEVNWYSDIPHILAQHGYIDSETEEMWVSMIGFRNVLVHQYADIDRQIVYDVLQNQLEAFNTLRRFFAQFI
jgi:uncharacterized protein YutE (UPF0331/DUF86 family)